jgi:hypothetical protein
VQLFTRWFTEIYTSAVNSDHALMCAGIGFMAELAVGAYQWLGRDEAPIYALKAELIIAADNMKRAMGPHNRG